LGQALQERSADLKYDALGMEAWEPGHLGIGKDPSGIEEETMIINVVSI
jgi:hypothetical protein